MTYKFQSNPQFLIQFKTTCETSIEQESFILAKTISMKSFSHQLLLLLFFFCQITFAQISLVSWNIKNLGHSKSEKEISFMAKTLQDFDVVAIQEVVAGPGGAQAVANLADALNRSGAK